LIPRRWRPAPGKERVNGKTSDSRKYAGRKRLAGFIVFAAVLFGASLLVLHLMKTATLSPLLLLLLAALISIAIPMVRSNFFPSARDCAEEFNFHERRLEEEILREITESFGQETLNRIFSQPGRLSETAGTLCRELLGKADIQRDDRLRFALRMAKARFHEQNGDLRQSADDLSGALEIRPNHFIANFRLAVILESIGSFDDALGHYRRALHDSGGLSRAMKNLTTAQIDRIAAEAK
jgi:tetratricopeptide (TPR) repeat protein